MNGSDEITPSGTVRPEVYMSNILEGNATVSPLEQIRAKNDAAMIADRKMAAAQATKKGREQGTTQFGDPDSYTGGVPVGRTGGAAKVKK